VTPDVRRVIKVCEVRAFESALSAHGLRSDPSEGLLSYRVEELRKRGVPAENVLIVTVPGVLDIPLALYKNALIALGAVVSRRDVPLRGGCQ
jgi:hypothetical protein